MVLMGTRLRRGLVAICLIFILPGMGWLAMHLLKIDESGALYDSDEAVDLRQPAGDIVFLTSADTEVSLLARAAAKDTAKTQIRIANYLSLTHHVHVELTLRS